MNSFTFSLRYIRSRKLESGLAVFGIVLGVATLAGTLSLVASYEKYYDKFSKSPAARQIKVMQATRVRVSDDAAILIGATEAENIRFTADEAKASLDVCPDIDSFYEADYRTFVTTASSDSASGPGFGFGGGGGGGVAGAAGGPSPSSAGSSTRGAREAGPSAPGGIGGPPGNMPPDGPGMPEPIDTTLEKPTLEKINGAMVSGGFFRSYSLKAEYGDVFSDAGDNSGIPGAVLGATLAGKLYASVTKPSDLIGKKVVLNHTTYDIIGVLAPDEWNSAARNISFNEMAFVLTASMRNGAFVRDRFMNLSYTVKESGSPARAAVQLENYYGSVHGAGSVVAEANLDLFRNEVTKRQRILALMAILASACALTAAINLFNLMTSRVMRRRKPIAIMRAVGAWNARVFSQVMIEASIIGTAGTIGGIALSPAVVGILGGMLENAASRQRIPVSVDMPVLVAVGLGALAVSLVFAAIPAKSGSSLVITDALRSE